MIPIKKVTLIFDAVVTSVLYESVLCVRWIKLITQRTVVYTTLKYPVFLLMTFNRLRSSTIFGISFNKNRGITLNQMHDFTFDGQTKIAQVAISQFINCLLCESYLWRVPFTITLTCTGISQLYPFSVANYRKTTSLMINHLFGNQLDGYFLTISRRFAKLRSRLIWYFLIWKGKTILTNIEK